MEQQNPLINTVSHKKTILISLTIFFVFTTLILGYLFLNEKFEHQNSKSKVVEQKVVQNTISKDSDTFCDRIHAGEYSWESYLTLEDKTVYYKEMQKDNDILCVHEIFALPERGLPKFLNLHEESKKVTFFLQEGSYDFSNAKDLEYYIIDLNNNSVNKTGIVLPFNSEHSVIFSGGSSDRYIVYYPVFMGNSYDDNDPWDEGVRTFETLWNSSSIYVLNLEGEKYEIPGRDLSPYSYFLFTDSSSPDLIAYVYKDTTFSIEIEDVFKLDQLFNKR